MYTFSSSWQCSHCFRSHASFTRYVRRALDALGKHPIGASGWYERNGALVRAAWPTDPILAAQVAAALSPAVRWELVLERLPDVLAGRPVRGFPRRSLVLAARLIEGHPLDGPGAGCKVRAFAANLAGNLTPVTVDRHAARAVGFERVNTPLQFHALATAYRSVAEGAGLPPAAYQAFIWEHQRG